jgi:hypothetical protein
MQTIRADASRESDALLERAAAQGFTLVHYEAANGQTIWEWRRGDEPRPQFAIERAARHWMSEWLDRASGGDA